MKKFNYQIIKWMCKHVELNKKCSKKYAGKNEKINKKA